MIEPIEGLPQVSEEQKADSGLSISVDIDDGNEIDYEAIERELDEFQNTHRIREEGDVPYNSQEYWNKVKLEQNKELLKPIDASPEEMKVDDINLSDDIELDDKLEVDYDFLERGLNNLLRPNDPLKEESKENDAFARKLLIDDKEL